MELQMTWYRAPGFWKEPMIYGGRTCLNSQVSRAPETNKETASLARDGHP